ncbi:radical SAM protein [Candidatus Poribacteria bacterium]|nr:radical SAM protein [Candidatus Poribacteria bacterium]
MSDPSVISRRMSEIGIWKKISSKRVPLSFSLEITARCNNNCRHCYINLPAGDTKAKGNEISVDVIGRIADEAVELGSLWVLISGGEPLLRKDFSEIYISLKKKGLVPTVFTNACLITKEHIEIFNKYPPKNLEVTVYGASEETYEKVTRQPGSYKAFVRGLDLLLENDIKVRLKAMALKSNLHEMDEIARFCRERTKDFFRFDPILHMRYDFDPVRNEEIRSERLSPQQIVELERADPDRAQEMEELCDKFILPDPIKNDKNYLFGCASGIHSFVVGYDGVYRLCSSLWHPDCLYDLKTGTLAEAWNDFTPKILRMTSDKEEYHKSCGTCPIINLCLWCPAHTHLETGQMDERVDYFCKVAHERAKALRKAVANK